MHLSLCVVRLLRSLRFWLGLRRPTGGRSQTSCATTQTRPVLPLIAQKRLGVSVLVVKNHRKNLLHAVDVAKFNAQHGNTLTVKESNKFHDRFLIIDKTVLIHVGASLNFLGKRCFAFASLDKSNISDILAKI